MSTKSARNRAILILLVAQSVPFVACTTDENEDNEDENIRDENDCQSLAPCDSAHFSFSDTLAAGEYALRFGLADDEIDCTVNIDESGATSGDCDFDWLALSDEYLEIGPEIRALTLTLTDENGCSASASVSASDYAPLGDDCGGDCEGAMVALDLSDCAAGWGDEAPPERPACEIGYDWSEKCEESTAFGSRQIAQGCGYTWIKSLYTDAWRNTVIDADGIVVFQEVYDPLSQGSSSCLGGTIPECADLPDRAGGRWPDVPEQAQENECLDDDAPPERPACEIGYDWAEVCDDYFAGLGTQVIEGCGYTWIRGLYADSQRDTIIDGDGIVVFQEWSDPLSTISPVGCLGGTIPECADLPDDTNNDWDGPSEFQGNECPDGGMGGAGGAGN